MKRVLLVVCCAMALLPAAAAGSISNAPLTPAKATAAFGHLLHQVYGPFHGYWTCPARQSVHGSFDCMGEVEAQDVWHQLSAEAYKHNGIVDFHVPYAKTWTRKWSPFSRHYILRSREGQVPGVISVNSSAYDWGWLAGCAGRTKAGASHGCDAYDGDGAGLGRFYGFKCSRSGAVITCRNAFGDAMRYRPHG